MIDSSIVGKELSRVCFPVDRSKLAELSKACGDTDPTWWDSGAARSAGYRHHPRSP